MNTKSSKGADAADKTNAADETGGVEEGDELDTGAAPNGADEERFDRYQNSVYRLISMVGGALVAVLGITGFAVGQTLEPSPPPGFYWVDAALTAIFLVWYLLGMRCRLDLSDTWVHVATKYGDFRIDRDQVVSIEPDLSIRGSVQWSGRPLIIRYLKDDKPKSRRAYGCLPTDRQHQDVAVAELQRALGRPEDAVRSELDAALAERLAQMEPETASDEEAADSDAD